MSSHVRRLQYQQRQTATAAQLGRVGSASSIRVSEGYADSLGPQDDTNLFRPGYEIGSVISGTIDGFTDLQVAGRTPSQIAAYDSSTPAISRSAYLNARKAPSMVSGTLRYDISGPPGSVLSQQASTVAGRSLLGRPSLYAKSNLNRSRSLGASKASLVTAKSGRSTIQIEHHDRKVQLLINAVDFKKAQKPYWWSIFFFTLFLLTLFFGLLVICLRYVYMNIILSVDVGESIGPLLCAGSFFFLGLGMKFLYDAYQMGAKERQNIKYQPASASTVAVKINEKPAVDATEGLVSGQTTDKALTRAPIETRTVVPSLTSYQ